MKQYVWKINMKNGDTFTVKNYHGNPNKFLEELLGHNQNGIIVNHYETVGRENLNAVAIIGTEVSSVEYATEWNK